jgi:3-isopropylmalate/(R)-2-methylmalate dehydratase small subunit
MGNTPKSVRTVEGTGIVIRGNDIDTDRIIPARFMKCVTFDGLGEYAFYDVRYSEDGSLKEHPMNDPRFKNASILVVNSNFGCGSSREHAPQALVRWGIRGVVGESFAEIFAGNCTAMGIPAVTLSHAEIEEIMSAVENDPTVILKIDITNETVTTDSSTYGFNLSPAFRNSLMAGTWDSTAVLLENLEDIRATANRLPYLNRFAV